MFEKLQEKVKGYGNSIRQGTQKITDTQNVNRRLEALEREQNGLFRELGEKYYLRCKDSVPEEETELFGKIAEIEQFKSGCRRELQTIRGVWACDCGKENPIEARFCASCGTARPAEIVYEEKSPAEEVCQNCGKPVLPEAVFCGNCGARIIREEVPEEEGAVEVEAIPEEEDAAEVEAIPEEEPAPEAEAAPEEAAPEEETAPEETPFPEPTQTE